MPVVPSEVSLTTAQTAGYAVAVVALVLGAGLMSGLTLGLLSLDTLDLRVLQASGSPRERAAATALLPLVSSPHWLLVTLLLANAACMEALPLFLDRLLNPLAALLLSITAILAFGEIIPQALCSRHGVRIGAALAPGVRGLMWVLAPVAWPLGKLLDRVLGHEDPLMPRTHLKAMVALHGEGAGLGGGLTAQEVSVISGAMDLKHKTAISAMTPMADVFSLSDAAPLNDALVNAILRSGHSRVPVYHGDDPLALRGLVLVKEALSYWRATKLPSVGDLTLRPLLRLPADTPLLDVLAYFKTGRSHMVLLTAPAGVDVDELRRRRAWVTSKGEDGTSGGGGGSRGLTPTPAPARATSALHPSPFELSQAGAGAGAGEEQKHHNAPEPAGRSSTSSGGSASRAGRGAWNKIVRFVSPALSLGSNRGSSSERAPTAKDKDIAAHITLRVSSGRAAAATSAAMARLSVQGGSRSTTGGSFGAGDVPVGILTLEDLIEELLQDAIFDETDRAPRRGPATPADSAGGASAVGVASAAHHHAAVRPTDDLAALMASLPPTLHAAMREEMLHAANAFVRRAASVRLAGQRSVMGGSGTGSGAGNGADGADGLGVLLRTMSRASARSMHSVRSSRSASDAVRGSAPAPAGLGAPHRRGSLPGDGALASGRRASSAFKSVPSDSSFKQ